MVVSGYILHTPRAMNSCRRMHDPVCLPPKVWHRWVPWHLHWVDQRHTFCLAFVQDMRSCHLLHTRIRRCTIAAVYCVCSFTATSMHAVFSLPCQGTGTERVVLIPFYLSPWTKPVSMLKGCQRHLSSNSACSRKQRLCSDACTHWVPWVGVHGKRLYLDKEYLAGNRAAAFNRILSLPN